MSEGSFWLRFGWIIKFPAVLATTLWLKFKYRGSDSEQYVDHLNEVYSSPLLTDNSDKFDAERRRISTSAMQAGTDRVLDVATGAGWQALDLKRAGFHEVVAIDLVPERIEFCRRLHQDSGIDFRVMDATRLEFPDDYFDAVVVSAALHDLPPSVKDKAITELARVCRGRLVLFEPRTFRNPIAGRLAGFIGELVDESLYMGDYMRRDISEVLQQAGLRIYAREVAWHGVMEITVAGKEPESGFPGA